MTLNNRLKSWNNHEQVTMTMNEGLKSWNDHEQSFKKFGRWLKKLERPGTIV